MRSFTVCLGQIVLARLPLELKTSELLGKKYIQDSENIFTKAFVSIEFKCNINIR